MPHLRIGGKCSVLIFYQVGSKIGVALVSVFAALVGCKPAKEDLSPANPSTYPHGLYVLCEGNFGWGEGSIYYFDTSASAKDVEDAYKAANGFTAGNVVHSMALAGDTAYLIVNNSNKVEALDAHTLKRFAANTTLASPRWVLPLGAKLWVSDLYANRISVLDRQTLTTETTLVAKGWTEQMQKIGNKVFVATRRPTGLAEGDKNQHILVFDALSAQVLDSIKLGGQGAEELCLLPNGDLLVGLEKDSILGDKPSLVVVDVERKNVQHIDLQSTSTQRPRRLQVLDNQIFWLQGDVLRSNTLGSNTILDLHIFGIGANLTSLLMYLKEW
jgi:hypothetical protein